MECMTTFFALSIVEKEMAGRLKEIVRATQYRSLICLQLRLCGILIFQLLAVQTVKRFLKLKENIEELLLT